MAYPARHAGRIEQELGVHCSTLIVGAGLAGLALAEGLERARHDYLLVEARSRLGGRILSESVRGSSFDLGPTWYWGGQPRMHALLSRLGIASFEQHCSGGMRIEDASGAVQTHHGFAPMQGSLRIAGGVQAIISSLSAAIPSEQLVHAELRRLERDKDGITATLDKEGSALQITAENVVLALPPRVAEATLTFAPSLPAPVRNAMATIPTWMAGHAKLVAVFDRPYWREAGLSGDAMSRRGPLVEIHDASPEREGPFALFGFVGVAPDMRAAHKAEVEEMTRLQLVRIFGSELERPRWIKLHDWAQERFTSTPLDHEPLRDHPVYGLPRELEGLWDGHLHFASTEVAPEFGGYLEGALEAAEQVVAQLSSG